MLAGFRFFFSLLPSFHRIVPQVESFHRILCATGALERRRGRESTLRNESGVDGMNKGGGGGEGDTLSSLSLSRAQTDTCSMFSKLHERRERGGKWGEWVGEAPPTLPGQK